MHENAKVAFCIRQDIFIAYYRYRLSSHDRIDILHNDWPNPRTTSLRLQILLAMTKDTRHYSKTTGQGIETMVNTTLLMHQQVSQEQCHTAVM